ncbi:MAG: ABC transporter ATP-binding protein [Bacteroidaceae bacterium]|nr:ABC transporter ATP-binding protein [Bacteroidaceae bacterium]
MNAAALILSNLAIGYADGNSKHQVVDIINARLYSGELVSLVGLNGAGKSTLLRTISAFQHPLSGTIEYCGCDFRVNDASQLSRHLAIVLTGREPIYNLSVREVVAMGRMPYTGFFGLNSMRDKRAVDEAMELLGISSLANRMIETLSDGERQKAMIAKAVAQETPIILLDEPTAFLDFASRVSLMQSLRTLAKERGKAILLSTHDLELALRLSDRLWLMDKKRMYVGSVEELSESGALSSFIDGEGICYDTHEHKIVIF